MKGIKYIYNMEQAYFYIEKGVKPLGKPEVNPKTNKIFFKFNFDDTKEVYDLWCKKS